MQHNDCYWAGGWTLQQLLLQPLAKACSTVLDRKGNAADMCTALVARETRSVIVRMQPRGVIQVMHILRLLMIPAPHYMHCMGAGVCSCVWHTPYGKPLPSNNAIELKLWIALSRHYLEILTIVQLGCWTLLTLVLMRACGI
jgi:hypothetical protein